MTWWTGEIIAGTVDLKVQMHKVKCVTRTHDSVFVTLHISVQYKTTSKRAHEAFYQLADPVQQLDAFVMDSIRSTIATQDLDSAFSQKDKVSDTVLRNISEKNGWIWL